MSEELLVELKAAFDPAVMVLNGPGVYALWSGDEVVFVGKSYGSIGRRLKSHSRDKTKQFVKCSAVRVEGKSKISKAEEWLIGRLRPKFNKTTVGRKDQYPQICSVCHELTGDEYALSAPLDTSVICGGCREEWKLFSVLRAFGCLTDDGVLTGELDVILKRHFKRRYET